MHRQEQMTPETTIHTLLIGQPQEHTDSKGSWRSSIFRTPVTGPTALGPGGLAGDQVTDTHNHGSPDQAVCCYPLAHYDFWNQIYGLIGESALGPGGVGENWTLTHVTEQDVCVGDVWAVGGAVVQVSAPRYPCSKQERKLQLKGFVAQVRQSLRTGWYLRVLTPGTVQAGEAVKLMERPNPGLTLARVNANMFTEFEPAFARQLLDVALLSQGWKAILARKLTG
jgi:MOSC domain-containing protein YiiM